MDEEDKRSLEEIHDYWKNESLPEHYLRHSGRSELLYNHINKYIDESKQVLEIGCNLGRNLNYLYENNYKKLTGIEISEEAINQLKKYHPHLIDHGEIIHSSVENIIEELPTNQYDLVFTMAVLEHIHPDSEWIFKEIARITDAYLMTIEAEKSEHWRIFPRNYKEIFEELGFKQIEEGKCGKNVGLQAYTIRVFKKV
ncbi:class I SAM-dependent methyltransferase [Alkalibacillus salilacus]|uniref:SAM-dependent methyltransferase n=1 Tax=Alkalibacillus salilacus TaxID=284582 RepID=A0ABT9VF68_9BACI|nr:class I SAM-dependent methyltransferase [Alkalibacillus salilacus]MDQ0159586.1 SAM-dependent methyltransferase [Alkalibacillus salilacus]